MHCYGLDTRLGDGKRAIKDIWGTINTLNIDYGLDNILYQIIILIF